MMRFMQWLHRWVSLILVLQVLLWLVSGLFFSFMGHHAMSGHQYKTGAVSERLNQAEVAIDFTEMHDRFPSAHSIKLVNVSGKGQYQVTLAEQRLFIDANTGQPWETDTTLATELALSSYDGPGQLKRVSAVSGSDEVKGWQGAGFRIDMADDLNTRIYVDAASARVVEHRNTPWAIADWAFRLHFMDYSGGRSFNHLLIWTAGLLALWFSLSGLLLLGRNIAKGDFNPRRNRTWLDYFQQQQQPVASDCGGGGTCGLCKVNLRGDDLPVATAAERALLRPNELADGVRLSCQHKVSTAYDAAPLQPSVRSVTLRLERRRELTPTMTELTFVSSVALEYAAGQFVQFQIPHRNDVIMRYYSMANRPDGKQLVFTVRRIDAPGDGIPPGVGSNYLCGLGVGAEIEALGPFGDFLLTEANDRTQLFIGGGAGVAPLRAQMQTELASEQPRRCVFFYGARNVRELCYRESFEMTAGLSYTPVLSEAEEGDEWDGAVGYVHDVALQWLAEEDLNRVDVYVCGPPAMLKATLTGLAELGVPRNRIRFDDFGI